MKRFLKSLLEIFAKLVLSLVAFFSTSMFFVGEYTGEPVGFWVAAFFQGYLYALIVYFILDYGILKRLKFIRQKIYYVATASLISILIFSVGLAVWHFPRLYNFLFWDGYYREACIIKKKNPQVVVRSDDSSCDNRRKYFYELFQ